MLTPFLGTKFKNKFRLAAPNHLHKKLLYFELLQSGFDSIEITKCRSHSSHFF